MISSVIELTRCKYLDIFGISLYKKFFHFPWITHERMTIIILCHFMECDTRVNMIFKKSLLLFFFLTHIILFLIQSVLQSLLVWKCHQFNVMQWLNMGRCILKKLPSILYVQCTNGVNWLLKITRGYSEYVTLENLNKIVTSIFQRLPMIQLLTYLHKK